MTSSGNRRHNHGFLLTRPRGGSEPQKPGVGAQKRFDQMTKRKRKLTPKEKAEKKRRRQEFMTVFVGGKMKRVRRPPSIDGLPADEFIRTTADPIHLHQNEMWEDIQNKK
jgi:hypothetical protein